MQCGDEYSWSAHIKLLGSLFQNQDKLRAGKLKSGTGDTTQASPANCHNDKYNSHKMDKECEVIPHILTNQCNCFLYIFDIKQEDNQITTTLSIGYNFGADHAKYQLPALPF